MNKQIKVNGLTDEQMQLIKTLIEKANEQQLQWIENNSNNRREKILQLSERDYILGLSQH